MYIHTRTHAHIIALNLLVNSNYGPNIGRKIKRKKKFTRKIFTSFGARIVITEYYMLSRAYKCYINHRNVLFLD